MGIIDKLLVGGVAALFGAGLLQAARAAHEESRRKSSTLAFDHRLTELDFAEAAERLARTAPRLSEVIVNGMNVKIQVRSVSGLTTWGAEIDFNDYGKLTGRYWITCDNTQSPIPEFIAEALRAEIERRISHGG